MIRIKRAYEAPSEDDGYRVLVDRLWPRGLKKVDVALDEWAKGLAPSDDLRKRFAHDHERWEEFRDLYFRELDRAPELVAELRRRADEGTVTLVYAARDEERNNAVALREYLERPGRD